MRAGTDVAAGSILMHHPVDPLFLVIPLILSLLPAPSSGATPTDTAVPFQPLSSLISTAASSSAHALAPPFTSPKQATKGEYNEDVSRLLGMKRVKRVFRLCCDRKGASCRPDPHVNKGPCQSCRTGRLRQKAWTGRVERARRRVKTTRHITDPRPTRSCGCSRPR